MNVLYEYSLCCWHLFCDNFASNEIEMSQLLGIFCKCWQFSWPELVGRHVLVVHSCKYSCSNGLEMWEPSCHLCSWKNGSDANGDSHPAQVVRTMEENPAAACWKPSLSPKYYLIIPGCELWITTSLSDTVFKTSFLQLDLGICS